MTMTFLLAGKLPFELKSCLYFQDFIPQSYYNREIIPLYQKFEFVMKIYTLQMVYDLDVSYLEIHLRKGCRI